MRNFALWAIVITMFLVMISLSQNAMKPAPGNELTTSEFVTAAKTGQLSEVSIDRSKSTAAGILKDGESFTAEFSFSEYYQEKFEEWNVPYTENPIKQSNVLVMILTDILPFVLFIGIAIWFMRSMQGPCCF